MSVTIFAIQKKYAEQTCPAQHLLSGKRDSKLVQARVDVTFYLHPQPLKGAMRVTGSRHTKKHAEQTCPALHPLSGKRDSNP